MPGAGCRSSGPSSVSTTLPRRQVDGVQDAGVELGDVQALLVGARARPRTIAPAGISRSDLAGLQVDLADGAGVLVRDVGPAAVLVGDDAVGLGGDRRCVVTTLPVVGVEEDDAVLAVDA